MKRRILGIITALALCQNLCPTWARAAGTGTGKAIQFGTSGIADPTENSDTKGQYYTPNSYIYFGVNSVDSSMPIKWRVLDADKANDKSTSGMFLLSEYLLPQNV